MMINYDLGTCSGYTSKVYHKMVVHSDWQVRLSQDSFLYVARGTDGAAID